MIDNITNILFRYHSPIQDTLATFGKAISLLNQEKIG